MFRSPSVKLNRETFLAQQLLNGWASPPIEQLCRSKERHIGSGRTDAGKPAAETSASLGLGMLYSKAERVMNRAIIITWLAVAAANPAAPWRQIVFSRPTRLQ